MRTNFDSTVPCKFFSIKLFLGFLDEAKINASTIEEKSNFIIKEFANKGIIIKKSDVNLTYHTQSKIEKVIAKSEEYDDHYEYDYDSYEDDDDSYENGEDFDDFGIDNDCENKFREMTYVQRSCFVTKTRTAFYLSASAPNPNYEAEVEKLNKMREEEWRTIREFNSPENAKKRKEEKLKKKAQNKINHINQIEANEKARQSMIAKYGDNWKEVLLNLWSKSK